MGLKNAGKSETIKSAKPGNLFQTGIYVFILISCFSFFYNKIISYIFTMSSIPQTHFIPIYYETFEYIRFYLLTMPFISFTMAT